MDKISNTNRLSNYWKNVMKIGYFDCFSGAAGDMIAGSMIDVGLDFNYLLNELDKLHLNHKIEIKLEDVVRCGIKAKHFYPVFKHEHHHRHLSEIIEMIDKSGLSTSAKELSKNIFRRLGEAEAKVHGTDIEDVHFHEVGAFDAIIDICSAAIGFEALGLEKIFCSKLHFGGGVINCEHGILPVPGPATAELIKNVPCCCGPIDFELLTPTGAAILTTAADYFGNMPEMKIEKIGYGAGTLDDKHVPNVLRLLVGEASSSGTKDNVCLLEANIDDSTPEAIGYTIKKLFEIGVLDAYTTAIGMKESRPGIKISVLCKPEDVTKIESAIFQEGITIGLRKSFLERSKLERQIVTVNTRYGNIRVKLCKFEDKIVCAKPEYKDCSLAAQKASVSLKSVMDEAGIICQKLMEK